MNNYIERYWRDATPQDAIKEPPMVARFRYEDAEDWEYDLLVGWDRTDQCHWRSELDAFEHCQVYDAPDPGEGWRLIDPEKESPEEGDEFFEHGYWKTRRAKTDPFAKTFYYRRRIQPPKPEPGEGWRLIDPHKEPLREGDEFMFCLELQRGWIQIDSVPTGWAEKNFYRRRIEQPKPKYEPFKWEDREQLRGRWVQCVDVPYNEWMMTTMYLGSHGELRVNSVDADRLRTGYVFADTGEPVGRRME